MKTSLNQFSIGALVAIAHQKNDETFTSMVKVIIKKKYEEMNLSYLELNGLIKNSTDIRLGVLSELFIEMLEIDNHMVSPRILNKVVNNLDFNYLMRGTKTSKNDIVRDKCCEKIFEIFDELEAYDENIKQELSDKIIDDKKELRKRRKNI